MTVYTLTASNTAAKNAVTINTETMTPDVITALIVGMLEISTQDMSYEGVLIFERAEMLGRALLNNERGAIVIHSDRLGITREMAGNIIATVNWTRDTARDMWEEHFGSMYADMPDRRVEKIITRAAEYFEPARHEDDYDQLRAALGQAIVAELSIGESE